MKMNKEDEVALEESINDWKDKARGKIVKRQCPLCVLGEARDGQFPVKDNPQCTNCIIKEYTSRRNCHGTPYWYDRDNLDYYQREIEFLESLRPEKKVKKDVIEVGDEVIIYDSSYMFRLSNGKIGNRFDNFLRDTTSNGNDDTIYIVLETGTCLPEGSDHRGGFSNDTIIYNPKDGSYVFARHKFLKLVTPKHCPECGKAK